MKQKHYVDIERLKEKYTTSFTVGEKIVVQTKIDGSNASFTYDPNINSIVAFSRKTRLSPENNLRGFYEFATGLPVDIVKRVTQNGRFIIFGEYLVTHTVKYPEEMYNKFYMFDVWDTEDEIYLPYEESKEVFYAFHRLTNDTFHTTFRYVPLVYCGPFRGWAETMKLLDAKTTGAQPCEEGIVIKSQERFESNSKNPTYLKIVNEKFSEVHDVKPKKAIDPEVLAARAAEEEKVATIVNYERVNKMLFKLIDEGIVPIDWDEKSIGLIMKNMPRRIIEDCIKEEPEIVESCEHFGKIAGSLVGSIVRKMLAAR